MDKTNFGFYSPILVIGFKGHPINRFCADVYVDGKPFYEYKVGPFVHRDIIHSAYADGLKVFEEALKVDGTIYRLEKYPVTLQDYVNKKYYKSAIKQAAYNLYLWIGKKVFK